MWKLAAAAATGVSHLRTGAPCQDRHAVLVDGDRLVVAVSDGAGSASRAEAGAQLAVETALAHLATCLPHAEPVWEDAVRQAARNARQAVLDLADREGLAPREFACTLLLIALSGSKGAALQIGDGLIAYRDADAWGWFFWPQKGQYANTTNFLIEEDAEAKFECVPVRERVAEVAVMSDGLETIALHFASLSIHEPFLEAVLAPLRSSSETGLSFRVSQALEGFLTSDRIASRTDDDLTLVLAARA